MSKNEFIDSQSLANKIKKFRMIITGTGPIDKTISTVGGIAPDEIDDNFQLKKIPSHYVIGEMPYWDAPTGGYLL